MRVGIALVMALSLAGALFAQEEATEPAAKSAFAFSGGIELGADVLATGPDDADGNPTNESWTRFGFQPDFSFGKFGIGLDLSLRFQLYPAEGDDFEVYEGDWYLSDGDFFDYLDLYLSKVLYLRYGKKGEDPLFAKLGLIDDLSLGNGFIVGNYSNMRYLPQKRIFGLDFGVDGSLFGFPYVGFEALTGNLARLDVVGARLFVRPLAGTELPLLKNLQAGLSAAFDADPLLYDDAASDDEKDDADTMAAYGLDLTLPIRTDKLFPLVAFADLATNPNDSFGAMTGVAGRLIGIFSYGAQLRFLQDGFIPGYFDANYDLYRAAKYYFMTNYDPESSFYVGWYASLGTSLIEDKLVFTAALDGPFASDDEGKQTDYPHLRAVFRFGEGLLGGFFFDASYEKYYIGAEDGFFEDLVDPTNSVAVLAVNYKTGASVLTLKYNAVYDPDADEFNVSSSISASMKF